MVQINYTINKVVLSQAIRPAMPIIVRLMLLVVPMQHVNWYNGNGVAANNVS
jgi:hypothetical protein